MQLFLGEEIWKCAILETQNLNAADDYEQTLKCKWPNISFINESVIIIATNFFSMIMNLIIKVRIRVIYLFSISTALKFSIKDFFRKCD